MDALHDLTILGEFEGCSVQPASPLALIHILPLLTSPHRSTFPWAPLKHALEQYFGSYDAIDPMRIEAGWAGLNLIIAGFKRLEQVDSEAETAQVMTWLLALKQAAIRRSIISKTSSTDHLYSVLAQLHDPVRINDFAEIMSGIRSSGWQPNGVQNGANGGGSTSYERGGVMGPPSSASSSRIYSTLDVHGRPVNNGRTIKSAPKPSGLTSHKKRRVAATAAHRNGHIGQRDTTVSTSALSSFADYPDRAEDQEGEMEDAPDTSSEEEEEDEDLNASDQNYSPVVSRSYATSMSSTSNIFVLPITTTPTSSVSTSSSSEHKIEFLAQRLAQVTGLPYNKCLETVSKLPRDELIAVDPTAPIPHSLLPQLAAAPSQHVAAPPHPSSSASTASYGNHIAKTISPRRLTKAERLAAKQTGSAAVVEYKVVRSHDPNRPAFSYSALIGQAILANPMKRSRLAEIYEYVSLHYPYYTKNECGWQNSIRHNLSLQPVFSKVPDYSAPGKKGCFWMIDEGQEWRFEGGGWKKMDTKDKEGKLRVRKEKAASKKAAAGRSGKGSSSTTNDAKGKKRKLNDTHGSEVILASSHRGQEPDHQVHGNSHHQQQYEVDDDDELDGDGYSDE